MAVTPAVAPTEARIREVATELFYERGYHATTMRDIAAGVGIKAGSLYNHYPSKQEILFRICFDTAKELLDGMTERLDGVEGVEEQLRTFIKWHVEFHANCRFAARVADDQLHVLESENRKTVVAVRDTHERRLTKLLDDGVEAGLWKLANRRVIAYGIEMMCTGVDAWYRPNGPVSAARIGDAYADFVIAGLRGGAS